MKVLFYVAELQSLAETKAKEDMLSLWANVNEVQIVGAVYELNAENSLGTSGQGAIADILKQYEVDAVVVASVKDFSANKADVCACVKGIREMGADVISLAGDIPNCRDCMVEMMCEGKEPYRRAYHCTVKIFHE